MNTLLLLSAVAAYIAIGLGVAKMERRCYDKPASAKLDPATVLFW